MSKPLKWGLILSLSIFIIGEGIGRYIGLISYPLFYSSNKYEYLLKPNQSTFIYHNKFITNEYSMRSLPITKSDTNVVLLIGDSVVNGGNLIDHDSLSSTILEKELSKSFKKKIRVLNISAKSWGPDNAAAFVKEFGLFKADVVVLVVNSHDAYDNMTYKKVVGISPDYPDRNAVLAWQKIIEKGLPRLGLSANLSNQENHREQTIVIDTAFNSGFNYFKTICYKKNISLIVYLHSEISELQKKQLHPNGKEIIRYCSQNNIFTIIGLKKETKNLYLDEIHFNNTGHRFLANALYPAIYAKFHKEK
jgi:hypothetical protein